MVSIKTWAKDTGKLTTYRDFEVYDAEGNLCAIATSKWVLIDILKGRIIKIEQEIIDRYAPETKSVFSAVELDKLQEPEDYCSIYTYTVQRSSIDINNHMHNLYYLDLAYEALPEEIYANKEFNNIEIMYKKEVKSGYLLKCLYHYEEATNTYIVTIKSEDDTSIHAIINLSE